MEELHLPEPKDVFHYFQEISQIPRASYHEERIADYLVSFADLHGLVHYRDQWNNVILIQDATPGYEAEDPLILQGHTDMVCEKEPDHPIDFSTDPLQLEWEGDALSAKGTTLGADDGIAVAYLLALLSDSSLQHPRLEAVFTASEEVGMEGAKGIDLSPLQGRKLLNIDSEEEGIFLSSSAGGSTVRVLLPLHREKQEGTRFRLTVQGLTGGHSGTEIHKERANACLLLGRTLLTLSDRLAFGLSALSGGNKQNAIPRSAEAELLVRPGDEDILRETVARLSETYRKEHSFSDPELELTLEAQGTAVTDVLSQEELKKLLLLLNLLPKGVQSYNPEIPELVKTSLNLGVLRMEPEELSLEYLLRSSLTSERHFLEKQISLLSASVGAEVRISDEYPAWEWDPTSELRSRMVQVYEELYGKKPKVEAVHAGLECGLLMEKLPGMDAVSIGPDIQDIHTTAERLSISSTARVYQFLKEFIKRKWHG